MTSQVCNNVQLASYQCGPAQWLKTHPDQKGIGCFYQTGFGKTLTAVAVCIQLLQANLVTNVVAITPKSLLENMRQAFNVCGGPDAHSASQRTTLVTYEKVQRDPSIVSVNKDTLLILDEAHRLRSAEASTYKVISAMCRKAGKVLILTATPMVNEPADALMLLKLIEPELSPRMTPSEFGRACKNLVAFPDIDKSGDFPTLIKETVFVPLDKDQLDALRAYDARYRPKGANSPQSNSYLTRTRQLSMGLPPKPSSKLKQLLENLKAEPGRALVFAEFVSSGVTYIADFLKSRMKSQRIEALTGQTSANKRIELVDAFNTGQVDILVMSSAGQEGLDFKEVRSIHHMNTDWNPADVDQKNGRGKRYKSHANLPPEERFVKAYQYISMSPDGDCDKKTSGECTEVHLYETEQRKRGEIASYMTALIEASIPQLCEMPVKGRKSRSPMCSAQGLAVGYEFRGFNGYEYVVSQTKSGKKRWQRRR